MLKLESTGNESELLKERLRQTERELQTTRKESTNYQSMMQQSQLQYVSLDKKYGKAKKIIREFKQRELELLHREEYYVQCMQEKDSEYNGLVKKLKDRVINLEHELEVTQRRAGIPVALPYDSTSLKVGRGEGGELRGIKINFFYFQLTPQMSRRSPPKPLFHKLETDLSDTEVSDLSPDAADAEKTATVERKVPSSAGGGSGNAPPPATAAATNGTNGTVQKEESFDPATVPQHELLDNSMNKSKSELGK